MESNRKKIARHNAANRYPIDEFGIKAAINDLCFLRASMFDVKIQGFIDDNSFEKENPEHPLAAKNRFIRQNAANYFLLLAQGSPELITENILDELHISLFDCDASIRFDIAQALGILSYPESSQFLLELIKNETESKMVKQISEEAFGLISSTQGQNELNRDAESSVLEHSDESRQKASLENISKITTPIKVSPNEEFYILLSSLSYESQHGIITESGKKNLEVVRAQDFSYKISGNDESFKLDAHKKRAFVLDLRKRVEKYVKGKLDSSILTERMLSIVHVFKMFGYSPYYAGQEGSIRERLFHSVGKERSSDLTDEDFLNNEFNQLAAYYMGYTDYEIDGVPQQVKNASNAGASVFISHSSVDKDFAIKLANDLLNEGLTAWLDEWELRHGDSLWDKIEQGIVRSDFVLLLMSPESIKSNWVRREINAALSVEMDLNSRFVIPILCRNCEIPMFIKEKYYCDLSQSYNKNFGELLKSITIK